MFSKYLVVFLSLLMCLVHCVPARQYQFIPARCVDHPGVEKQIGGPLSLCSFPPGYQAANEEDIQAVIKHIQGLNLN